MSDTVSEKWFADQGMPRPKQETEERMLDAFPVRLWYRDTRKEREWWCSRCYAHGVIAKSIGGQRTVTAEEMEIVRMRHRVSARCPSCGRTGEMLSCGMIRDPKRYEETRYFLLIMPKSQDEVWIVERCMYVHPWRFNGWDAGKKYTISPQERVQTHDMVRFRLKPGSAEEWSRTWYREEWEKSREIRDYARIGYGAAQIIEDAPIAGTFLQYNAWDVYRKGHYGNKACYLANYAIHPSIEMLVKMGYGQIVQELVAERKAHTSLIDWDASDPRQAIGLPKDKLRLLQKYDDQIGMIREYKKYSRRGERDPWACACLVMKYKPAFSIREWQKILKGCGSEELELYRYFERIERENPGCGLCPAPLTGRTWKDYIDAAKAVGYDLTQKSVVMPRNLYAKHDEAVALRNAMRQRYVYGTQETKVTQELTQKFTQRAPELARKYAETGGSYFIRIPQTPEEIIEEGRTLSHCVGGFSYIKNHAEGKNPILFLRRTSDPDKPYYTMEIDVHTNRILQCEGCKSEDGHGRYGHIHRDDLPQEAKDFLNAWESGRIKKENKKETKAS